MLNGLRAEVSQQLSRIRPLTEDERAEMMRQMIAQQQMLAQAGAAGAAAAGGAAASAARVALVEGFDEADPATWGNPGRNDPCPCGSGEKFKHCHGKL